MTPSQIAQLVAHDFGIPLGQMRIRRSPREAFPRGIAMYLQRECLKLSLPAIGREWGRDHTSVLQAVRKVQVLMAGSEELAERVGKLRAQVTNGQPAERSASTRCPACGQRYDRSAEIAEMKAQFGQLLKQFERLREQVAQWEGA